MTYYEVLLTLHILAAIVWIGGGIAIQFLAFRADQTRNGPFMQALGDSSDWLAKRLFIPASLATLIFGILLTIEGPWTFDILWLDLGFVGFALSFLTGILFLKPEGERIGRAIAAHGPESKEARHHVRRIVVVERVQLVILLLVVGAMSIKPTSDDSGTLLLFAALTVAAIALGAWTLRSVVDELPQPEPAD
jgi:uncharacterized membrane protein